MRTTLNLCGRGFLAAGMLALVLALPATVRAEEQSYAPRPAIDAAMDEAPAAGDEGDEGEDGAKGLRRRRVRYCYYYHYHWYPAWVVYPSYVVVFPR